MSLLVRRGGDDYAGPFASIPLPAGTQVGDLIVVTGNGGNDGGRNKKLATGAMSEPRMTGHYSHPSGDDWWGIATDLSDIQVAVPAGGVLLLVTFGATAGNIAVGEPSSLTLVGDETQTPIEIPALQTRAVVIVATDDTGSFANTGGPGLSGYSSAANGGEAAILWWSGDPPSPAYTWEDPVYYQDYDRTATILPLLLTTTASPVVRLYPRDDGRGMSSAPRLYPPSPARRIVGGYQ